MWHKSPVSSWPCSSVWLPGHSGRTEDWGVGGHGSRRGRPVVRVMFLASVKFTWKHSGGDSSQSNSAMCFHLHSGISMQQSITHVNDNLAWDRTVILLELCSSSQRWARKRFLSCCSVVQCCPTLCHPMDCSPPISSVPGILQARILEWVAISFSRESSRARDRTLIFYVSCFGRWILYQ